MSKEILITGVKVTQQMSKARAILKNQVILGEALFQQRKKSGTLSPEVLIAIKTNSRHVRPTNPPDKNKFGYSCLKS